jgi:multidrug efflux pump subunit AcrB
MNQLSIVGLVVALGLLVDDSIVVVENIERWLRDGYSRKEAALKATSQIGLAVIGCTATLVVAFLPLLFLPEGAGDFITKLTNGSNLQCGCLHDCFPYHYSLFIQCFTETT